jgi:hypothetical protein
LHWKTARNHAERLAQEGCDVAIHVHAQPDATVERTFTLRGARASVPDLDAFFSDTRGDGLELELVEGEAFFELS